MTELPIYYCHDCQDAQLYAWWDSVTEAVIKSYRTAAIQFSLAWAMLCCASFGAGIWWTLWRFGLD